MINYPNDLKYRAIIYYKDKILDNVFGIAYILDTESFIQLEMYPQHSAETGFEDCYEHHLDEFVDPVEVEFGGYEVEFLKTDHILN